MALHRVSFARALGFEPDEWQARLLASDSSRLLLNCSRQSGKSTMSALIALHRSVYHPGGSLVLCLAPSERQSKELFSKISEAYHAFAGAEAPSSDRKLGVHLPNGSRIEALPGSERSIRGFSGVSLLLLDEAARVDEALYHAVRPMLAGSNGTLMMLSTPFGRRGVFHSEWTGGVGWERYEIAVSEYPRIPASFLEEERLALPAAVYAQEYMCEFAENGVDVFTEEMLAPTFSDYSIEPLYPEETESRGLRHRGGPRAIRRLLDRGRGQGCGRGHAARRAPGAPPPLTPATSR